MDPSGRKVSIGIGLSPGHLAVLDEAAAARGISRSGMVQVLIEKGLMKLGAEVVSRRRMDPPVVDDDECRHEGVEVIAGGLKRCRACGVVRGKDGTWRAP